MKLPGTPEFDFFGRTNRKKIRLHILLALITFFTTMVAGVAWQMKDPTNLQNLPVGLTYAILIIIFITAHEFAHYIAARIHGIETSLPYYIPQPIPWIPLNFGTFGAIIKTRQRIPSLKVLFDVGAAGPIAGFIVCLAYLAIGFSTVPPIEYLYEIHPEYLSKFNGQIPDQGLFFGTNIIFELFRWLFASSQSFVPPMNEIYHYPFLCVGWFGIFVTAMNLLPIGQLDGGHIIYSLFGKLQPKISSIAWWIMVSLGFGALLATFRESLQLQYESEIMLFLQQVFKPPLDFLHSLVPWYFRASGVWLFWGIITRIVIKIKHPPVYDETPIDDTRKLIGWVCIGILLLSFTYDVIYII